LYPQSFLREARWQAAYPPLLVGTVLLGVVIALATAIAGRLSQPILELRRQLSRLVQGDFQPMSLPQRNDELRDLIGSVNVLGDQLEEMRRAIKRSERLALLGQLSAGLAHQLRNSVTGARLAVQLHQRHCQKIDPASLEVALRQLAMTESHLQRFLTAGQPMAPRRAACDLRPIVDDVLGLLRPSCDHRNVALQCETPRDAPCSLWADADHLRQLLMNLMLNGIEAAGAGGWVRLEMTDVNDTIAIRVLDSGPGPAPALIERLFEPFATGKPEGVGLGLAVARQIVESHGGTIRYTGEGRTCFEVLLPAGIGAPSTSATALPLVVGAAQPNA
jgi:signal transduction histidine kinase